MELRALRDRGLSQRRAAKVLGLTQAGVHSRCQRLGVSWPPADSVRVQFGNRNMTLPELSRATGLPYHTLYARYHIYGLRGEALTAPLHSRRPKPPYYSIGLARDAWQEILADLRKEEGQTDDPIRARQRIASRYSLPYGAVSAAAEGKWEKLD